MNIHLYLVNGRVMQLTNCLMSDFDQITTTMNNPKKDYVLHDKLWIKKSEILGIEILEEAPLVEPPIVK